MRKQLALKNTENYKDHITNEEVKERTHLTHASSIIKRRGTEMARMYTQNGRTEAHKNNLQAHTQKGKCTRRRQRERIRWTDCIQKTSNQQG